MVRLAGSKVPTGSAVINARSRAGGSAPAPLGPTHRVVVVRRPEVTLAPGSAVSNFATVGEAERVLSAEATAWVWRHSPWRGQHHKFVLHLAVADVVNDVHDNLFWMAQSNLAEKAGVSRESACRWLGEAVDSGLLEVVRNGSESGKPNCYRFVMPTGGCDPQSQGGVTTGHRGCDPQSHKTKEITQEGTQTSVATNGESESRKDSVAVTAESVLNAWVEATGRNATRVRMNGKRLAAVKARLREGYTGEDLIAAVRGIARSPWHMGDNPDGKRYDDMLVAIRDGERVEKFRDLLAEGTAPRSKVDQVMQALNEGRDPLGALGAGE